MVATVVILSFSIDLLANKVPEFRRVLQSPPFSRSQGEVSRRTSGVSS